MSERFIGFNTIYGAHGEHETPYLTRIWIGRLRLHIFHRGDADPDCHDHPWDFWTFPLTSYVEEVACVERLGGHPRPEFSLCRQVVRAFRLHFRRAEHTHRVLGPAVESYRFHHMTRDLLKTGVLHDDILYIPVSGRILTLVWQGQQRRQWGFLRNREGRWCWTPWKDYVFGGGKHAPCEPGDGA